MTTRPQHDRQKTGRRPTARRAVICGAAGMIIVGSSVGVSRTLVDAPLFTAQAWRYAIAALVLFLLARALRVPIRRPRGWEWLWLLGVAVTGLVLFNIAVVRGVAHAEPAVIAVAVACAPVLIGVLGPLLESRRPTRRLLLAAAVVSAGGVLVAGTGRSDLVGLGWALLALGCEAGFTLLAVPVLGRHGPWGVSLHAVWMAAALLAVLGVTSEGATATSLITGSQWVAIGYLAFLVTVAAFVLWYSAVVALGSGRAGLLTGIAPISAAVCGALLGAGLPELSVWAGMAVVLCGLAVGLGRRSGTGERRRVREPVRGQGRRHPVHDPGVAAQGEVVET